MFRSQALGMLMALLIVGLFWPAAVAHAQQPSSPPASKQQEGDQSAHRMADDHRWLGQALDHRGEVVDIVGETGRAECRRRFERRGIVVAQRRHLDAPAVAFEELPPVYPHRGGGPHAVDQECQPAHCRRL